MCCGGVVELVTTSPCHGEGRGFESLRSRHFQNKKAWASRFGLFCFENSYRSQLQLNSAFKFISIGPIRKRGLCAHAMNRQFGWMPVIPAIFVLLTLMGSWPESHAQTLPDLSSSIRETRARLERGQIRHEAYLNANPRDSVMVRASEIALDAQAGLAAYQRLLREISAQLDQVERDLREGRESDARRLFWGRSATGGREGRRRVEPGWMRTFRREIGCDPGAGVGVRLDCADRVWRRFEESLHDGTTALGISALGAAPAVAVCTVAAAGPELAAAGALSVTAFLGGTELFDALMSDGPDAQVRGLTAPASAPAPPPSDPVDRIMAEPRDPCREESDRAACQRRLARRAQVARDREWIASLPFRREPAADFRSQAELTAQARVLLTEANTSGVLPAPFASWWLESEAIFSDTALTRSQWESRLVRWEEVSRNFDQAFDSSSNLEERIRLGGQALRRSSLDLSDEHGLLWGSNLEGAGANDEVRTLLTLAAFSRRNPLLARSGLRLGVQVFGNIVRPVLFGEEPTRFLDPLTGRALEHAHRADIYEPAAIIQAWLDRARREGRIAASRADASEPGMPNLRLAPGTLEGVRAERVAPMAISRSDERLASALPLWPSTSSLLPESRPEQDPEIPAARQRSPGPPPHTRSFAQLRALGVHALSSRPDAYGFPNLDLASFLLELEAADPLPPPTGAPISIEDDQVARAMWSTALENASESPQTHQTVADSLISDLLSNYYRDHVGIVDALLGEGTNCQGQTQILTAAFQHLRMPPPPGSVYAVQVFKDHVQLVTYNRTTGIVTNLLDGSEEQGVSGALLKPQALLAGILAAHGHPIQPRDYEQWLIARPEAAALTASLGAGDWEGPEVSQVDIRLGMDLPRASSGPIPLRTTVRPSAAGEATRRSASDRPGRRFANRGGTGRGGTGRGPSGPFQPEQMADSLIPSSARGTPLEGWIRERLVALGNTGSRAETDQAWSQFISDFFQRVAARIGPAGRAALTDPRRLSTLEDSDLPPLYDLSYLSAGACPMLAAMRTEMSEDPGRSEARYRAELQRYQTACERIRGPDPFAHWLRALGSRPHAMMALIARLPLGRQALLLQITMNLGKSDERGKRDIRNFAYFLSRAIEVGTRPLDLLGDPVGAAILPVTTSEPFWIEFEVVENAAPLNLPVSSVDRSRNRRGSRVVVPLDTLAIALLSVSEVDSSHHVLRRWTPAMTSRALAVYRASHPTLGSYTPLAFPLPVQRIANEHGGGPYPDLCGGSGLSRELAEYVYAVLDQPRFLMAPDPGPAVTRAQMLPQLSANVSGFSPGCLPQDQMVAHFQRLAARLGRPPLTFGALPSMGVR